MTPHPTAGPNAAPAARPREVQRFFFVHVMKTGGTSFVFRLQHRFAPEEVYPSESLDRRFPGDVEPYASIVDLAALAPERRAAIRVYTGHLPFAARALMPPGVITLTILREPVARTVSVLKHFKRLYPRYRDAPLDAVYDDPVVFANFVENYQTRMFAVTPDDEPRSFASSVGYREIRAELDTPLGSPRPARTRADAIAVDAARLALAESNLRAVDVLGVNEEFAEFLADLGRRFGWWDAGDAVDARANVSTEDWPASAALRRRIAGDNHFDVELYDFARELVRARRG